ncbi:MAG: bacterioferritin [Alphaproteobacteria bacterium]
MPRNNRRNGNPGRRRARGSARARAVIAPPKKPGSGTDDPVRGDARTIEHLNRCLKNELTAINQYFLHSRMLADWGVSKLAEKEYEESLEEMRHSDWLIQRILFLGGLPNLQNLDKLLIGEDVEEIITCDLKMEEMALRDLRAGIAHVESMRDFGTRHLLQQILDSEEAHVDYLQTQLRLVRSMGIANYIQKQVQANESGAKPPK